MGKHLNNKYSQKLLDAVKKFTTDAIKTPSKRAIQIRGEPTGDLIGNKIADKITSFLKKFNEEVDVERATTKKRYISPEERQQIIDELRLVY